MLLRILLPGLVVPPGLAFFCLALGCGGAHAATFPLAPGQALVGELGTYITRKEDTLLDVGRANDLGYAQLMTVNRDIDPWLPGAGRIVTLPVRYLLPDGPRKGIVIDLAQHRLFYFPPGGGQVQTFPVGVGAEAGMTPHGTTRVVGKVAHPAWFPPASIRKEQPDLPGRVPPGPDNPLGDYAISLGWPSYFIHGTNKPYGVGRNVSHGCIRLYPEDIQTLFAEVTRGTPVRVTADPIHLAWVDGALYLALAPSRAQVDAISENRSIPTEVPADLHDRVVAAAGDQAGRINWSAVTLAGELRTGLPVRISDAPPPDAPPTDSTQADAPPAETLTAAQAGSAP